MHTSADRTESRRRFLKFLAGSPLIALWAPIGSIEESIAAAFQKPGGPTLDEPTLQKLIASPDQALNVFDFRPRTGDTWRRALTTTRRFTPIEPGSRGFRFDRVASSMSLE